MKATDNTKKDKTETPNTFPESAHYAIRKNITKLILEDEKGALPGSDIIYEHIPDSTECAECQQTLCSMGRTHVFWIDIYPDETIRLFESGCRVNFNFHVIAHFNLADPAMYDQIIQYIKSRITQARLAPIL